MCQTFEKYASDHILTFENDSNYKKSTNQPNCLMDDNTTSYNTNINIRSADVWKKVAPGLCSGEIVPFRKAIYNYYYEGQCNQSTNQCIFDSFQICHNLLQSDSTCLHIDQMSYSDCDFLKPKSSRMDRLLQQSHKKGTFTCCIPWVHCVPMVPPCTVRT
jgi:hypothetical protein